jgi:hypothetical protein
LVGVGDPLVVSMLFKWIRALVDSTFIEEGAAAWSFPPARIGGRLDVENQRRAERLSTLCMGHCHVENDPSDMWRECEIRDVSTLGLGIEFSYPDPVELLGLWQDGELRLRMSRRITVRLELGPSVDMTVAGEVRNAGSGPDGSIRAGIEFVSLTEPERSIVDHLVEALVPHQTIADPVSVLSERPESLVEARGRHLTMPDPVSVYGDDFSERLVEARGRNRETHDPVSLYGDLPESLVLALGGREVGDPAPVLVDLPESFVEALSRREIREPAPVLGDVTDSFVEALGQEEFGDSAPVLGDVTDSFVEALSQEEFGDPAPVLGDVTDSFVEALDQEEFGDSAPVLEDLPEDFVEALGQEEINDPVPVLDELRERFAEFLAQEEIGDPVPVLGDLSEFPVEDLGEREIGDPVPVLIELPETPVKQQAISGPVPLFSGLARKGGELAFQTYRVVGSDVFDLVVRLPIAPRVLNVAGWRARLGLGETGQAGAADESGDV